MADDPRNSELEVKIYRPQAWSDTQDFISAFSMVMAGATMITRNRQLAWPAVAIALSGWVNQRPVTAKDGGGGVGPLLFALGAVSTAYLPMMIIPAITDTPLST